MLGYVRNLLKVRSVRKFQFVTIFMIIFHIFFVTPLFFCCCTFDSHSHNVEAVVKAVVLSSSLCHCNHFHADGAFGFRTWLEPCLFCCVAALLFFSSNLVKHKSTWVVLTPHFWYSVTCPLTDLIPLVWVLLPAHLVQYKLSINRYVTLLLWVYFTPPLVQ